MTRLAIIDERDILVTPVFRMQSIENIPKSETAGHAVLEMKEVVEVRFAGSKNYAPIFLANDFWKREGNQTITYAERWPEQYRTFKEGSPQEAMGTPLEMLRGHGVTPEQLSLCRALRIYSIEALHALEGPAVKTLGMNANALKAAARAFIADRDRGLNALDEVEALKVRIAELEARSTVPPVVEPAREEVDRIIQAAEDAYAGKSDTDLKDEIETLAGARPRGNPSRATLVSMLDGLKQAA